MTIFPYDIFKKDPDKSFIVNYAPIFANLNPFEKNLIIQKSKVVEYNKGDIIYKQQDSPDAFYCVISGRVRIFTVAETIEKTLEYLSCGKYFGIISILTGEAHSVSAEASNNSKVLRISKEDFQSILNKIPKLAIDLSQTLSRRLRRKDVIEKKIFESNIVSIFSAVSRVGCSMYAFNLSLSLKKETNKNIILLNVSKIAKQSQINLDRALYSDDIIKDAISEDPHLKISILNVRYEAEDNIYAARLNALLTYLTGNYHYVIVDLPSLIDTVIFDVLNQSDIIHIITDYNSENLEKTKILLSDLSQKVKHSQEKIKIIINTKEESKSFSSEEACKILNYKIYATLPKAKEILEESSDLALRVILDYPQSEYAKAIRRIARYLGDVRVGLALSGGAAFGLTHIGVIKILESQNIPIDIIAGSSMGALIGAFWASGIDSKGLEEIVWEYNNNKRKAFQLLADPCFPKISFAKGRRIRTFLEKHLRNKTFQDTRLPFKVVACNLSRRQEFIIDSGSLSDAVMASIAIPGLFPPVKLNGDLIIDGGIIESVPIGVLVKMGIKKIIAVNTLPSPETISQNYEVKQKRIEEEKRLLEGKFFFSRIVYNLQNWFKNIFHPNILDIIINSIQTMEYVLAETECQKADVVISPMVSGVEWSEFFKVEQLIKKGEDEAVKSLDVIKNLVNE